MLNPSDLESTVPAKPSWKVPATFIVIALLVAVASGLWLRYSRRREELPPVTPLTRNDVNASSSRETARITNQMPSIPPPVGAGAPVPRFAPPGDSLPVMQAPDVKGVGGMVIHR